MGATSARHTEQVLAHVETIVAIELLAAAQGIDFRRREMGVDTLGEGTAVAYDLIRQRVPFLDHDTVLSTHSEQIRQIVADGAIKEAVEAQLWVTNRETS